MDNEVFVNNFKFKNGDYTKYSSIDKEEFNRKFKETIELYSKENSSSHDNIVNFNNVLKKNLQDIEHLINFEDAVIRDPNAEISINFNNKLKEISNKYLGILEYERYKKDLIEIDDRIKLLHKENAKIRLNRNISDTEKTQLLLESSNKEKQLIDILKEYKDKEAEYKEKINFDPFIYRNNLKNDYVELANIVRKMYLEDSTREKFEDLFKDLISKSLESFSYVDNKIRITNNWKKQCDELYGLEFIGSFDKLIGVNNQVEEQQKVESEPSEKQHEVESEPSEEQHEVESEPSEEQQKVESEPSEEEPDENELPTSIEYKVGDEIIFTSEIFPYGFNDMVRYKTYKIEEIIVTEEGLKKYKLEGRDKTLTENEIKHMFSTFENMPKDLNSNKKKIIKVEKAKKVKSTLYNKCVAIKNYISSKKLNKKVSDEGEEALKSAPSKIKNKLSKWKNKLIEKFKVETDPKKKELIEEAINEIDSKLVEDEEEVRSV